MLILISLLFACIASGYDLREREIPDWISITLLGVVLAATAVGFSDQSWFSTIAGGALGLAVTAPLFYLGGLGGGDVKLVTALGAALGAPGLTDALFWMAVAGGVLALIAKWRRQNDFAYAPAIAAGVAVYCLRLFFSPEGIGHDLLS